MLQVELSMDCIVSSNGTAAVVDGSTVLLTPLQRALVPPPMCAVAAVFPHPVQCLAFGEHQGCEVRPPPCAQPPASCLPAAALAYQPCPYVANMHALIKAIL